MTVYVNSTNHAAIGTVQSANQQRPIGGLTHAKESYCPLSTTTSYSLCLQLSLTLPFRIQPWFTISCLRPPLKRYWLLLLTLNIWVSARHWLQCYIPGDLRWRITLIYTVSCLVVDSLSMANVGSLVGKDSSYRFEFCLVCLEGFLSSSYDRHTITGSCSSMHRCHLLTINKHSMSLLRLLDIVNGSFMPNDHSVGQMPFWNTYLSTHIV